MKKDLDDFPVENKKDRPNLWLKHIAQSRDRSMDSRKWDHDKDSTTF